MQNVNELTNEDQFIIDFIRLILLLIMIFLSLFILTLLYMSCNYYKLYVENDYDCNFYPCDSHYMYISKNKNKQEKLFN